MSVLPDIEKYRTAGQIFDDLVDRPQPERELRLAQMAKDDPAMAQFVRELLAADAHPQTTLDEGPGALAPSVIEDVASCDDTGETAPQASVIGPYKVLGLIGRGGMGEVLLAERGDGQFEQKVAIKLLKRGMDSERVLRRFLQERRILARLSHPNIARLLDGGMTESGLPYFVMEYVEGEPITEFASAWKLDTRGRVELMLHVCEAVDFAHRNLVVHRDLKPSNILVGASGGLKLLDFGIAKLLTESQDDSLTDTGTRVMTPAYAAPEQILGEPITTSTDVYTLGLLLYELLIGKLPARATASTDDHSHDSIERPSALLRRSTTLPEASPRERARRARELRGDLDTIVLRAVRREPQRRYPSAGMFADDLRRWLDGRPVSARRDSTWYRFAKFVSRHRVGVAASAAAIAALLLGTSLALWQAKVARTEAMRAQRVTQFLVSVFQAADPTQTKGEALTARDILDAAVARLDHEFADAPIARGDLLLAIAEIRLNRGNFAAARDSAEKATRAYAAAAPGDALRAARARSALGASLLEIADYPLAKSHLVASVDALRTLDEPEHLAQSLQRLSAAVRIVDGLEPAIALQLEALALQRAHLPPGDPDMGDTLQGLAVLYEESQRYEEAERAHREALQAMRPWGDGHPSVLRAKSHFAGLLDRVGKRDESKALFEEALAGQVRVFGPDGRDTAETQFHYGIFLSGMRDHAGAERAHRGVLANAGATAILRAHAQRYLGVALTSQQRFADAVEPLRTAESLYEALFGAADGQRFRAQANRGYAMSRAGDPVGVLVQREAVEGIAAAIGPEAYELIKPLLQLGQCEREAGNARDALAAHERALLVATKAVGPDHVMTHEAQYEIARDAITLDATARARARSLLDGAVAARRVRDDAGVLGEYLLTSARLARATGEGGRAKRDAAEAVEVLQRTHPAAEAKVTEARALVESL